MTDTLNSQNPHTHDSKRTRGVSPKTALSRSNNASARARQAREAPEFQDDGIRFSGIVEMTLADWLNVSDHPHQRDTVKHAQRSAHLQIFSDSHRRVSMGIMPDGRRYKGDGHTRAYAWTHGMTVGLPPDLRIVADAYQLTDETALSKFYELFDNKNAVDTLTDEVTSASKAAHCVFQSKMMKNGRYVSAARFVHGLLRPTESSDNLRIVVGFLAPELMLLDSINPTSADFNGGLTMAALLTLARDKGRAIEFWRRYQEGRGWKMDETCDAVQALIHYREYVRKDKQSGFQQMVLHFRHAMSAYLGSDETPSRIYHGKKAKPRGISDDTLTRFIEVAKLNRDQLLRGNGHT